MTPDNSASATHENRICIIGCGRVGMSSAYALIQSSFVRELVLVGRSQDKTEGEVMDLVHAVAVPMKSPITVLQGDYAQAARSSIVVITAGAATGKPGVSRLDLLAENAVVIREIVGQLKAHGFDGILVMASNPVDVLARVARDVLGAPPGRVMGTGTLVDTARLRNLIADELDVEPRAVDAFIIGEHGDSEIAAWSGARVAGLRLDRYPGARNLGDYGEMLQEVRRAAPEVVKRKGHTSYAIGMCVQRICEAVLRNERAALSVSTLLQGEYGVSDVYLSTPCIIGKNGVERVIALDLDPGELEGLRASARTLQEAFASLPGPSAAISAEVRGDGQKAA
jgi:L-lactate dehydrogenase